MKILIDSIFYDKESIGIAKYSGEMAEWLKNKGNRVSVITTHSHYPAWEIKGCNFYRIIRSKKLKILISPVFLPKKKKMTALARLAYEGSYFFSSHPFYIFSYLKKPDILISVYPSIFSLANSVIFSKLSRTPLVVHVQDLQIDAASNLGFLRQNFVVEILKQVEKILLSRADAISTISDNMSKKIGDITGMHESIFLLPNWSDTSRISIKPRLNILRHQMGYSQEDFVILYSGNLGEKQGLEDLIKAAKISEVDEDVKFIICGSGGIKEKLIKLSMDAELKNISFIELKPIEELSDLLAVADLHIILQRRGAADIVMPSKLANCLASGRPTLVTAEIGTSLYDIIIKNDVGVTVDPEDPQKISDKIFELKSNSLRRIEMSKNARKFAKLYLDKEAILQGFEEKLSEIVKSYRERGKR